MERRRRPRGASTASLTGKREGARARPPRCEGGTAEGWLLNKISMSIALSNLSLDKGILKIVDEIHPRRSAGKNVR